MSVYCRELVSNLQVRILKSIVNIFLDELLFIQLMAAPGIEGVRMPDDASDVIIHRNGKFFINSFIPGDSTVSIKLDEPRKTSVHFMQSYLILHHLNLESSQQGAGRGKT